MISLQRYTTSKLIYYQYSFPEISKQTLLYWLCQSLWLWTKEPLDASERGEWKSWLKTQKTKIMASGPITSVQIDGETVETVSDFILLGSQITADGDCSHEIKRCLLLGRKVMTNLDSILKSRDITLSTKVHLVKAMCFPVVMYGCESWTIKSAQDLMLLNCGVGEDSWESLGLLSDSLPSERPGKP